VRIFVLVHSSFQRVCGSSRADEFVALPISHHHGKARECGATPIAGDIVSRGVATSCTDDESFMRPAISSSDMAAIDRHLLDILLPAGQPPSPLHHHGGLVYGATGDASRRGSAVSALPALRMDGAASPSASGFTRGRRHRSIGDGSCGEGGGVFRVSPMRRSNAGRSAWREGGCSLAAGAQRDWQSCMHSQSNTRRRDRATIGRSIEGFRSPHRRASPRGRHPTP